MRYALSRLAQPLKPYYEMLNLIKNHFHLTMEMARQEVSHRYSGQVFGAIWTIVHPLVFIAVYIFLFVFVFKTKIGNSTTMPLDYTTYLLSGLIPWLSMQELLNKGSTVITNHTNLVKQVVFPIEILPVKTVLASLPAFLVSLSILLFYILFKYHSFFETIFLLPVLIFLQIMLMIGWNFLLSVFGVFFRDTKDFVQIIAFVCMYFMPIFYLPHSVPRLFKPLLYINPFSYVIWCYQDILYFGAIDHPYSFVITILFSIMSFSVGYKLFKKTKVTFGNVL